mgnify:CR=1 FL=1
MQKVPQLSTKNEAPLDVYPYDDAFISEQRNTRKFCIFCEIITGRSIGNIRYEDDDVVVFDNRLTWVPVMLLVVPRTHLTQREMWSDAVLLGRIGDLAVRFGQELCPGGFRLLSNFGNDALQTQDHAHLHVTGGDHLGIYVRPPKTI